jgi:ERCC4-type nuclease
MSTKKVKQFSVYRDTREQNGWHFTMSNCISDVVDFKLKTGDYTVVGMENEFVIERKFSTGEIARNVVDPRFKDVLERLSVIPKSYIICEFSIEDILSYPLNSGIPVSLHKDIKLSPQFLMSCLTRIQVDYGIPIIYAGNRRCAERMAEEIMKRIIK